MLQTRFNTRIQKIELDSAARNQVQKVIPAVITEILGEKFAIDGTVELVQFPLGSLSASGKFADPDAGTIVYVPGTEKHKPYIRKWFNPPKPDSEKQLNQQSLFTRANEQWVNESDEVQNLWNERAKKINFYSGQTLYIRTWFEIGRKTGSYPGLGFIP